MIEYPSSSTEREQTLRRRVPLLFYGTVLCIALMVVAICGFTFLAYENAPPRTFPIGERIRVVEGSSLRDIADLLKEKHIIRSSTLFRVCIILYGKPEMLHAGEYLFPKALSTYAVAQTFIHQTTFIQPVRVTIPEGSTLKDFDVILSEALPKIEPHAIEEATHSEEGTLFPDTYLIPEFYTASDIVTLLKSTFLKKLTPYEADIASSTFSKEEVLILASILEKEANDPVSMRMVAGILEKRLVLDMPLQVDATFYYEFGKGSSELTQDDLHNNSPYNTYRHRGLPPTPIGSPGLVAIEAVLQPTTSDYLYYLTDKDGHFHYAKTFDEHKRNKALYLNE